MLPSELEAVVSQPWAAVAGGEAEGWRKKDDEDEPARAAEDEEEEEDRPVLPPESVRERGMVNVRRG